MKKVTQFIGLFVVILPIAFCCRNKDNHNKKTAIEFGTFDSLFSHELNEGRKIWVYVPQVRSGGTQKSYPVLYLLDGDAHYYSVAGLIQQLSSVNGNTVCPEMVIVGIPNTDRTRDLTPTRSSGLGDTTILKTSGGAENFSRFLESELIPYIDKNYPTTSHRTIIGHSFGGLFVTHALLNHPELFTNYIAIDPSLWWDNQRLSQQTVGQLTGEKYKNKSLFVAVANTMQPDMKIDDVDNDTTISSMHIRAILQFIKATNSSNDGSLALEHKYYEHDGHGSVPLIATYDAIRSLYKWYELKGIEKYFDMNLPANEMIREIENHYKLVSEKMGYEILAPEPLVNDLGYAFIGSVNKPDIAYALFKLNTKNYPTSANAFDSMGDYYLSQKDTVNAIATFEQALKIQALPYTKHKLDKLNGRNR